MGCPCIKSNLLPCPLTPRLCCDDSIESCLRGFSPRTPQPPPHRPQVAAHLGYRVVKRLYDSAAVESKLPCFNDLHPDRVADAVRAMYTMAYGYHGPGERRSSLCKPESVYRIPRTGEGTLKTPPRAR